MRRTRRENAIGVFPGQPNPKSAFLAPVCRFTQLPHPDCSFDREECPRAALLQIAFRLQFDEDAVQLHRGHAAFVRLERRIVFRTAAKRQKARIPSTGSTPATGIQARWSVLTRALASAFATLSGSAGGSGLMLSSTLLRSLPRTGSVWRQRHSFQQ